MNNERLYFNGINGATGEYLMPPKTVQQLSKMAQGETWTVEELSEIKFRRSMDEVSLGPIAGIDMRKLNETGWGIIFAYEEQHRVPQLKEALFELLELRKSQAGERYKEFSGEHSYRKGESKNDFIVRFKQGPGPVNPKKMPYYLLIIGSPEVIPLHFQYQLDIQFSVGRLFFDSLEEYASYSRTIVYAETKKISLPKRSVFFGPRNNDDPATELSATQLVKPVAELMRNSHPDWSIELVDPNLATKSRLLQLLGGQDTPTLLFTASHGMGFPVGDKRQLAHQGALLCQDWLGPKEGQGPISEDCYLANEDITNSAQLSGLIAFHFACYSAGTPRMNDFAHYAFQDQLPIAPHSFLSRLPQRMLGHPKGGALAVVGHVERAWEHSILWNREAPQHEVFHSTLTQLCDGYPIGAALEYFNQRYAEITTDLNTMIQNIKYGATPDDLELARMWTASNDARNLMLVGDPAVRLPVCEDNSQIQRPAIEVVMIDRHLDDQLKNSSDSINPKHTACLPIDTKQEINHQTVSSTLNDKSFLPPPPTQRVLLKEHPVLYQAWQEHIITGYKNNNEVFGRILDAFMRSHNSNVIMQWIIFAVGVAFFVISAVLALIYPERASTAGIFGGLSVVSFLTYFVSRPSITVEQNLHFITWLGLIYNSYWIQLVYMLDLNTVQTDLKIATEDAIKRIELLLDKQAKAAKERPSLIDTMLNRK